MERSDRERHELRKNWRNRLADILADISDVQKTERDWLSSTSTRDSTEEICGYFDDLMCGEGPDWAVQEELLSAEEARKLTPFHQAFDKFVDSLPRDKKYRDPQIVRSSGWAELAKFASRAYQALGQNLRADFSRR